MSYSKVYYYEKNGEKREKQMQIALCKNTDVEKVKNIENIHVSIILPANKDYVWKHKDKIIDVS